MVEPYIFVYLIAFRNVQNFPLYLTCPFLLSLVGELLSGYE